MVEHIPDVVLMVYPMVSYVAAWWRQELSLASDELRAVSAFLRDEHIRAKALDATAVPDAAKPAKAESPEALVPGKQQQNDQQSACFGEIQLSRFKDAISTIALVSDAAAAGTTVVTTSSSSIEYPPCWLWVCYGKRTECYPSWAPTQKTQPEQTDKVKHYIMLLCS